VGCRTSPADIVQYVMKRCGGGLQHFAQVAVTASRRPTPNDFVSGITNSYRVAPLTARV